MAGNISEQTFCGFWNKSKIKITGLYDGANWREITKAPGLNAEQKRKLENISLKNNNIFTNDKYSSAYLLTFKLFEDDYEEGKFSIQNIEVVPETDDLYKNKTLGRPLEIFNASSKEAPTFSYDNKNVVVTEADNKSHINIEFFNDGTAANNIKELISSKKLAPMFIENISVIYKYISKVDNTSVCVLTVEPDWIHFDDFKRNGLIDFWNFALDNPEKNCILVFQNLNITAPRCGLTPLFDVIKGNRPKLPFTKASSIPSNLKIFASLLNKNDVTPNDLIIPFDEKLFHEWNVLLFDNDSPHILTEKERLIFLDQYIEKNER